MMKNRDLCHFKNPGCFQISLSGESQFQESQFNGPFDDVEVESIFDSDLQAIRAQAAFHHKLKVVFIMQILSAISL